MVKKVIKKNILSTPERFVLVLTFKKHAIRLVLTSRKGVLAWKTSRSEGFVGRARSTRLTAQFLGELMGKDMLSKGIKNCEVGIKGPDYRMSYTRAILFAVAKYGGVKVTRVDILSGVRFGGTKFAKRANRKGKGKKKKKEKAKKKEKF